MAGRRQHFIPQSLLRAFTTDSGSIYVFKADGKIYETTTANAAVEGYFYCDDEVGSADSAISNQIEPRLTKCLASWRDLPLDSPLDPADVRFVMAHLLTRTSNVRTLFTYAAKKMMHESLSLLTNKQRITPIIENKIEVKAGKYKIALRQLLLEYPQFQNLPENLLDIVVEGLMPPPPSPDMVMSSTSYFQFAEALKVVLPQVDALLKKNHVNFFKLGDGAHIDKPEQFEGWTWFLHVFAEAGLILGDGCLIEATIKDGSFEPVSLPTTFRNAMFLPISKDKVVVGHALGLAPEINIDNLNIASARRSVNFFVAPNKSKQTIVLQNYIGAVVSEVDEMVKGAIEQLF